MNATGQQQEAIAAEGNVLVMAGAGTGKTSTLVARVAERLSRAAGRVQADRILMVTFTEAAAEEMRSRLRERLESMLATDPTLTDQVARLDLALIGTLHAFCLRLLREHGVEVGLEPQVTVLDGVEASRMARGAWMRWIEATRSDEAGAAGLRRWVDGGFDGDLEEAWRTVRAVHGYARTLAEPEAWLDGQLERWREPAPREWGEWMEAALPSWAADWAERLAAMEDNPVALARCARLRDGVPGDPEQRAAWWAALAEDPSEYPRGRKTAWGKPLEKFFEDVGFLASLEARGGLDPMLEDWESCRGWMPGLIEAVRGFGGEFEAAKRSRGGLDFADLEQRTLDLLVRRPGAAAAWCREQFEIVVVDECQDVNAAQEAILRAVSRDGASANRFLVGDVKQSIYRFRLADPRLFQATAARWSAADGGGRVVPLTGNFRSAETILRFVNMTCGRLMRPEVGGVGYGPEAALVFGEAAGREALRSAADAVPRVEVHLRVKPRQRDGEDGGEERAEAAAPGEGAAGDGALPGLAPTATALEARLVAMRLREIHECRAPVWDRRQGVMRPVEWGDMAVLLRGIAGRVRDFAAEFRAAGVPLASRQAGFFEVPAVLDLRALVQCLDNPLQDIPLATVLRSPLAGVSEPDALAVIRMTAGGEGHWWTLIQRFAGETSLAALEGFGPGVMETARVARERVRTFLQRHERWRRVGLRSGAAAALEAALDETGYEAWAASVPDRGETLGNVRRFLDMARTFDAGARGGLYRFLVWLDEQEAADNVEAASGNTEDAVRLMTVHRSKGLEFPVVAVAMMGSRFQLSDLTRSRVVREEKLGLCPWVQREDGRRYPSAALWLARRQERRELLGEELRLLYVALTRAVDRLLLFGTTTGKALEERWPEAARRAGAGPEALPVPVIEDAATPLDWLGPVLSAVPGGITAALDADVAETFAWKLWLDVPPQAAPVAAVHGAQANVGLWSMALPGYGHEAATREAAKVTATGLRRRMEADAEAVDVVRRMATPRHGASDPKDASAVVRGMAHHAFMQWVDVGRTGTEEELMREVGRLVAAGRLGAEEAAMLDMAAIDRFWGSELGADVRRRRAGLRREEAFTVRLTGADLRALGFDVEPAGAALPPHSSASNRPGLADDEFVVGQGVVDLALVDEEGIVIVDFKTDRVERGAATRAKAEMYRPQLAVYAVALSRIHGRPVTSRWLHFLATGESVAV